MLHDWYKKLKTKRICMWQCKIKEKKRIGTQSEKILPLIIDMNHF